MAERERPAESVAEQALQGRRGLTLLALLHSARLVLPFVVAPLAVLLIWHELHGLDMHQLRADMSRAHRTDIVLAACAAVGSVISMGLYDAVALRGLTFGRRWVIGAVCFAWTNFLTLGPIGGPAARFFLYRRAGVPSPEIAGQIARLYVGGWAGAFGVFFSAILPLPPGPLWLAVHAAIAALLAPATVLACNAALRRWRPSLAAPNAEAAKMGLIACLEWSLGIASFVFASRALSLPSTPAELARIMMLGHGAGMVSMVPGGLGAADAAWLKLETIGGLAASDAAAHVLLFRAMFYLLPWSVSLVALYVVLVRQSARAERWLRRVLAGALFVNALILLASTATPGVRDRIHAMAQWMPVGIFDASHGVAVVAAAWMLFLLRGLLRGYRAAAIIVAVLLLTSAVAHLLKGGDVEEAGVCVLLLVLLLGAIQSFRRRGRVPIGWELALAAAGGSVAFFLVVGLAAFEKVPYTADLWTRIGPRAGASRMLRGSVLVGLVGAAVLIRQAVRPVQERVQATAEEIARAIRRLRERPGGASSQCVGAGDKGVWESSAGGLAVYQRVHDKMIVYSDPIVPPGGHGDFLAELLAYADREDLDPVFYETSDLWLGPLHEFGFSFFKLGEEAVVPITGFTMAGGDWAGMRQIVRKVEKAGFSYRVCEPPHPPELIEQARAVSDAWLAHKDVREMQFSIGYFSAEYLQRFPIAGVFDAEGRLAAFLNVLETTTDATFDFMRFEARRVDNIMDYCIGKTMVWAAERGRTRFSLGMAPLADVGTHRKSRVFERGARLVYEHAERIYNYRGLKAYKTKFHPEWEPRYLAYQGPWAVAESLVSVMRLIHAGDRESRARIAAARGLP
ncbi:MAG: lysylphosphatidylglycerol synthetase family protein [Phycisphaerales bacterium]|nr:lysylphosphatidylglycerol synthetase family protein [Phycisphaerales bacterium]